MSKKIDDEYRIALAIKNMTMRDLAAELGISASYLFDILTGKRNGPIATKRLRDIEKILDIKEVIK